MIGIIGDVHWKNKEPYLKQTKKFFQHLRNNYSFKSVIFTGDFFDTSNPHHEEVVDEAVKCLLNLNCKVYIVTGNHEINRRDKNGNPLVTLNHIEGFKIITQPETVEIEGLKFIMLPFLYDVKEMKKYSEIKGSYDYVVSHVAYPGTNFGAADEIDLSSISAKSFFYGHIHEPKDFDNHHIIGVPVCTRFGEHTWKKRFAIIEDTLFRYEQLPKFVQFENVEFGKDPVNVDSILNIFNAPSIQAVLDRYKGLHIRSEGIKLVDSEKSVTYNEQVDKLNFSLESNFQEFSQSETEIRDSVKAKIQEFFTLVP